MISTAKVNLLLLYGLVFAGSTKHKTPFIVKNDKIMLLLLWLPRLSPLLPHSTKKIWQKPTHYLNGDEISQSECLEKHL